MSDLQTGGCCQTNMDITQLNLNHCRIAQQLLYQSVTESNSDVAIIAEPYRIPSENGNWVADMTKSTAIWTTGRYPIQEVVSALR